LGPGVGSVVPSQRHRGLGPCRPPGACGGRQGRGGGGGPARAASLRYVFSNRPRTRSDGGGGSARAVSLRPLPWPPSGAALITPAPDR